MLVPRRQFYLFYNKTELRVKSHNAVTIANEETKEESESASAFISFPFHRRWMYQTFSKKLISLIDSIQPTYAQFNVQRS